MFSQPAKQQTAKTQTVDSSYGMTQHLERLFKDHDAVDILKSGFNDTLVCIPPLLLVSSVGYNEGLVRLLEAGADVNLQNPKDGNTSLILATKGKYADTMKLLLAHKADLSIANQEGNNAFMVAVTTGSPAPVNLLWQHRKLFDVDYRNKKGYSALLLSAEKCWESCINMLLVGGSNKNLLSEHGDSALAIATRSNDKKSVQTLLQANVKKITENKSGDTPICIAISEGKEELFELIVKRMSPTEKLIYITRKLDLLKRKTLADCRKFEGYSSDVEFYLNSLFPVIRKLIWHEAFRRYFQLKSFPVAMIGVICRHMSHDDLVQRAAQLITMIMHDQRHLDEAVIEEFLQKQCPEILTKSLQFYTCTTKHKQTATMVSLMLPVVFSCTHERGIEWLRESWFTVISYIQVFEKGYHQLHYEENREMIEKVWKLFKEKFQIIQKEKADIACAELLKTEAEEKAKMEKREKKRARRLKKRTTDCEMSNNNASAEIDAGTNTPNQVKMTTASNLAALNLSSGSLQSCNLATHSNFAATSHTLAPVISYPPTAGASNVGHRTDVYTFTGNTANKVTSDHSESHNKAPIFKIPSLPLVSTYSPNVTGCTPKPLLLQSTDKHSAVTGSTPKPLLLQSTDKPSAVTGSTPKPLLLQSTDKNSTAKTPLEEVARIFAKASRSERSKELATVNPATTLTSHHSSQSKTEKSQPSSFTKLIPMKKSQIVAVKPEAVLEQPSILTRLEPLNNQIAVAEQKEELEVQVPAATTSPLPIKPLSSILKPSPTQRQKTEAEMLLSSSISKCKPADEHLPSDSCSIVQPDLNNFAEAAKSKTASQLHQSSKADGSTAAPKADIPSQEDLADVADDEDDAEDDMKQTKQKKKKRRRRKGKCKIETEETTEKIIIEIQVDSLESVKQRGKFTELAVNSADKTKVDNFEPVLSRRSLKQLKRRGYRKKSDHYRSPTPFSRKDEVTIDTDSIKSGLSSKSPSPMPSRASSAAKCVRAHISDNETLPAAVPSPHADSVDTQESLEIMATSKPVSILCKLQQQENIDSTSHAVSAEGQLPFNAATGEKGEEVIGDERASSIAEVAPASHSSIPQSWADLLKHKDLEFPKLGAKVSSIAAPWSNDTKKLATTNDSTPNQASRKEKECFTLSEFILPDVARKINSCDGVAVEPSPPTESCRTDSDSLAAPEALDYGFSVSASGSLPAQEERTFTGADAKDVAVNNNQEGLVELSPPILNDEAPKGEHLVTPTPLTRQSNQPPNQSSKVPLSFNNTLFSGSRVHPPLHPFFLAPETGENVGHIEYFRDEECVIDIEAPSVCIPDPRYTNYLTDIRKYDITASPLHDVGFLSNDSSEDEGDTRGTTSQCVVDNPCQQRHKKRPVPQQHLHNMCGQQMLKYDDSHSAASHKTWDMMAAFYHYQSTLLMQQQRSSGSNSCSQTMTGLWMPYSMVFRGHQSNSSSGYRNSLCRSKMQQTPSHQQPSSYQQLSSFHQYSPTMSNRIYNQQKASMGSNTSHYQIASKGHQSAHPEGSNTVLPWKEAPPVRRHDRLLCQLQEMPKEKLLMKGNIVLCLESSFLIGKSATYSSEVLVLLGMVGKMPVAVKRLPIALYTPLKETVHKLLLPKYQQHEHLVRYLEVAEDDHYGYIAQELCDFTLEEYLHLLMKKSSVPATDVLYRFVWQLLKGLQTLHCRCLMLHRNLKPTNVLIDCYGKLKLSDYGLTQVTSEGMTLFHNSNVSDNCWRPRECSTSNQAWLGQLSMTHYTMHSDIQVAAMLMYYTLTGGEHPFGDNMFDIEVNVAGGWPKLKDINYEVNHLLWLMLAKEPRERPDINAALRHPYFWPEKRRFELLVAVGLELVDTINSMSASAVSSTIEKLNKITLHSSSRDWTSQVENVKLLDEMEIECRSSNTVCDLLMFLYDVQQNYSRLSIHVRSQMGHHLHHYFLSRFPTLFIPVYKIVKSGDWSNKPGLKPYLQ